MDNNQNKDYSEFFKDTRSSSDPEESSQKKSADIVGPSEENKSYSPTYYYSYGPFKPSSRESDAVDQSHLQPQKSFGNQADTLDAVDGYQQAEKPASSAAYTYQHEPKQRQKKSSLKSTFAAFMAGAVVVASLMFTADHMNMFTSDQPLNSNQSYSATANGNNGGSANGSGVNTAAFTSDGVVRPDTISDIVEQSGPAVIKVETYVTGNHRNPTSMQEEFFKFFGEQYRAPQNEGEQRRQAGVGSGFIFEKNGYILTNEHVVSGADEIFVTVKGSTEPYEAKLLGSDFNLDLAVLKIKGDKDFPTLPIGDSSQLRIGEWVTAIGNPIGFDHTVSVGVISANEREISIQAGNAPRNYEHLLQTDASINPGNSGGPLLNMNGEVIGINTAVSTSAQGIGFAIPSSTILDVLDQLKNNETIPRPYIGVYLSEIDEKWMEELELDSQEGTIVVQVQRDAPASRAGLKPGDVVIELNGEKVKDTEDLQDKISALEVGARASMVVIRNGSQYETTITIGDRNDN